MEKNRIKKILRTLVLLIMLGMFTYPAKAGADEICPLKSTGTHGSGVEIL